MDFSPANLTRLGIAAGILFAAYKFGPKQMQGAAMAIGAVVVAKQIPYLKEVV